MGSFPFFMFQNKEEGSFNSQQIESTDVSPSNLRTNILWYYSIKLLIQLIKYHDFAIDRCLSATEKAGNP